MYKRHIFYWNLLVPLVRIFLRIRFGYRFEKAKDLPETYIVLSNHTTDWDPLFVGSSFDRQMYFVASEHIARWPVAFKFINYVFAPITRSKGTTATTTVMAMLRAVKAGKNVCMFAEGNRSWDGVTGHIRPATGKVIKSARCGLVTYRLKGGYFVSPRWSTSLRRGRITGSPVNVYTAEQLAAMSVDEINAVIARDLYEDAYATQAEAPARYKGKNLAENLQNLFFICPECGGIDTITSSKDTVRCSKCSFVSRYTEYGMLEGGPYKTIKELFAWQLSEVEKAAEQGIAYTAESGTLISVKQSKETFLSQGPVTLSGKAFTCGGYEIPIADISDLDMHGKRALVFSTQDAYYELRPSDEASSLKFQLLYEAYKNEMQKTEAM